MEADYFRMLYDYSYWARDKVLAAAEGISDEAFTRVNPAFTYGSLHKALSHILAAESNLGSRWRGEQPYIIPADSITSVAVLMEAWEKEEEKNRRFLETLHDDGMHHMVQTRRGDLPLWQLMAHIANHGTQHRSEAAEMLTVMGRSPGDLDLMQYLLLKHEHLTDGTT